MAKAYVCDRCGCTYFPTMLDGSPGTMCVVLAHGYDGKAQRYNGKFDLCKDCYDELENWLTDTHYEIRHYPPLKAVE